MSRVKMNAKHEYEFLANYKIMQNIFKAKKIDKVRCSPRHVNHDCFSPRVPRQPIPVDKLTKCKMQCVPPPSPPRSVAFLSPPLNLCYRDNLEFLQWIKRFWDQNYGGQPYDPVARRKGAPTDTPATVAPISSNRLGTATAAGRAGGRTPVGGE